MQAAGVLSAVFHFARDLWSIDRKKKLCAVHTHPHQKQKGEKRTKEKMRKQVERRGEKRRGYNKRRGGKRRK